MARKSGTKTIRRRPSKKAPPARAYHHGNLREALIQSGIELLKEGRGEDLSLREVARRAKVSHGAPYRHFEDRDTLFAGLAQEGFHRLAVAMEKAAGGTKGEGAFLAIGEALVQFVLNHPELFHLMTDGRLALEDFPELAAESRKIPQLYLTVATDLRPGGSPTEREALAVAHWSQALGLAHLILKKSLHPFDLNRRPVKEILSLLQKAV